MGRRKISIAPISDDRNRSVTFLKRKNGLFKKAFELGILCSADVAVIVFSNQGKLFEFHSGDMDQILLRYSHYNGPSHEKRGPSDYASKDVDEIAKLGLGGKMTTLEEAAAQAAADNDDDDEIDDDDEDEEEEAPKPTPPPKSKKRKVSSGAKPKAGPPARPSASVEPVVKSTSSPDEYDAARNLVAAAQQAQPPPALPHQQQQHQNQQPTQIPAAYASPGQNPFQAYGGFPGMLPPGMVAPGAQWGGYPQQPRMGQPGQMPNGMMNGGMPPHMGGMSQAPWMMQPGQPIGGMGGFMHHSQPPPWISQPGGPGGFPGVPGGGPQGLPMGFMGQPAPGFEALHAAYQQSQPGPGSAGMYASGPGPGPPMGYDPGMQSAPPSQQGTPMPHQHAMMDHSVAISRPPSVAGAGGTGSRAGSVAPRRGDSGSQKPRLSVSIPGGSTSDDQRQRGQHAPPILDPSGSQQAHQFTAEPDAIDDDAPPARADLANAPRFAADLLPSPSTFLADYSVSAGPGPHGYSLAGLNTAIAMANDEARSVFSWPKAAGAEGGGGRRESQEGAEGWFGKEEVGGRRRSGPGEEEGDERRVRRRV